MLMNMNVCSDYKNFPNMIECSCLTFCIFEVGLAFMSAKKQSSSNLGYTSQTQGEIWNIISARSERTKFPEEETIL